MKVLMLRPTYMPELSGGTHLAFELVEDMLAKQWNIAIITSISNKFAGDISSYTDECEIVRVSSVFSGTDIISRILWYIDVSLKIYAKAKKKQADVIISHSMPPLLGPLAAHLGKKKKIPVVYWENDVVSESILTTGIVKNKIIEKIFYKIAYVLEQFTAKRVSHIVCASDNFVKMHIKRGTPANKLSEIRNWIDTSSTFFVERCDNILFEKFKLDRNKFFVTYCGNLGVPQNVEILIDAAEMLQEISDIEFIIIGNGSREKEVIEYAKKKNLPNLKMFPLEPIDMVNYVYSIGNIGVVLAKKGTSKNGFPSKVWSMLSVGQPIISCFDLNSPLSKVVEDSGAGYAIEPDNAAKLKETILSMYKNRAQEQELRQNARKYAVEYADRKRLTSKFIEIIESVQGE